MTAIASFLYDDRPLRVVTIDGEPWFVLADLCRVLDLSNPSMVADRLDTDALSTAEVIDSMGRDQSARIVSEPGMYAVVFMSRKPEAAAFRRWITNEVLPSIRRTGSYGVSELTRRDLALMVIEAEDALAESRHIVTQQRARLQLVEPKALAFDRWLSANVDYGVDQVAKALAAAGATHFPNGKVVGRNNLFKDYLGLEKAKGGIAWIFRNARGQWAPYQQHGPAGAKRLTVKLGRYEDQKTGAEHGTITVRITPKGVADLAVLLGLLPEAAAEYLEGESHAAA